MHAQDLPLIQCLPIVSALLTTPQSQRQKGSINKNLNRYSLEHTGSTSCFMFIGSFVNLVTQYKDMEAIF